MLVPAMTLSEIRKEILSDFIVVKRKVFYLGEKIIKEMRKHHIKNDVRFVDYLSKQKNTWLFLFQYEHKDVSIGTTVYYYGRTGLVVITIDVGKERLHFHTAHFIRRYNERRNLGLVKPEDIIRKYLKDNRQISYQRLEEIAPGVHRIFGVIQTGIVLGYSNSNLNMIKLNTYITHEMLKGQQLKLEDYLKAKLSFHAPDFTKAE